MKYPRSTVATTGVFLVLRLGLCLPPDSSPFVAFLGFPPTYDSSISILPVRMLRRSFWVIVLRIYMAILQAVFLITLRSQDNCKAEILFLVFSTSMTAKNHFAESNGYDERPYQHRHAELCLAVIAAMAMLISSSSDRTALRTNQMVSPSGFLKMLDANFLSWK